MKTPTPNDMCSGTCGGKRENCPVPMACGWAEEVARTENRILRHFIAALVCIGLIIFCAGVLGWP